MLFRLNLKGRSGSRVVACSVLLAAAVTCAQFAKAEQPTFHFDRARGRFRLESRAEYTLQEREGRSNVETTQVLFQEEMTVGTKGWVYDPLFLLLDGKLSLLPQQAYLESDIFGTRTETGNWDLLADLRLSLLPRKAYPLTLYGGKSISYIHPPLAVSRKMDSLRYGGTLGFPRLALGSWKLPTRLVYQHDDSQTDSRSQSNYRYDRVSDRFQLEMNKDSRRATNRVEYEFYAETSSVDDRDPLDQIRHELRYSRNHTFDFGMARSLFRASDWQNGISVRSVFFDQDVRLDHSRWLSSLYDYTFDMRDRDGNDQVNHRASARLRHQWYLSLTSELGAEGDYQDSDTLRSAVGRGKLRFDYRKQITAGRLGVTLAPSYSYQDDIFKSSTGSVIVERHTVDISQRMELRRPNVIASTIRVVDPVSGTLFDDVRDYRVIVSGQVTELEIVLGGWLDPGFTPIVPTPTRVEVDYDFDPEASRTFTTLEMVSGVTLDLWDWMRFGIRYRNSDVTVLKGGELESLGSSQRLDPALHDSDELYVDLEAKFAGQRTRFEYKNINAVLNPRESIRLGYYGVYRPSARLSLGGSISYFRENQIKLDRLLEIYELNVSGSGRLAMNFFGTIDLTARNFNRWDQDLLHASGRIKVGYRYGLIMFELEDRVIWERSELNKTETSVGGRPRADTWNVLTLSITRRF